MSPPLKPGSVGSYSKVAQASTSRRRSDAAHGQGLHLSPNQSLSPNRGRAMTSFRSTPTDRPQYGTYNRSAAGAAEEIAPKRCGLLSPKSRPNRSTLAKACVDVLRSEGLTDSDKSPRAARDSGWVKRRPSAPNFDRSRRSPTPDGAQTLADSYDHPGPERGATLQL